MSSHHFRVSTVWKGNLGTGTSAYREYSRDHVIQAPGKSTEIAGSSDPAFRGDGSKYNPEELMVASLSTCHMLWMLHLCADAGIRIVSYSDEASGTMHIAADGSGHFEEVTLRPVIAITDSSRMADAIALHDEAHRFCFIASSVNFPVRHEPVVQVAAST